jgi:hypothetical protein
MKAEIGILCALREHVSHLLSVSSPLLEVHGCWLVENRGTFLAIGRQGRTGALSYQNARTLIERFSPKVMYTFGPAALVNPRGVLGRWYAASSCASLQRSGSANLCFSKRLESCPGNPAPFGYALADLLMCSEGFVANAPLVKQLAGQLGEAVTLLDMTAYGVSKACNEAGIPWKHFRWTTDYAGDTAVSQFVWNVRDLARRGNEVWQILEEERNECYATA